MRLATRARSDRSARRSKRSARCSSTSATSASCRRAPRGFVERVYARAPGDVVAAGAPLVDVLNPEWLGAQQEYLAVKATGDAALAQAARQRLVLLGMPAALIERAERSRPAGGGADHHARRSAASSAN